MAESGQGGQGQPLERIGRYEVLREIGRGGMAVVYVARQPDLDRQVALKELSRFHAGSAEYAHRFLRESRLAGSLNHPNIVTVHEYFEHAKTPYIAMEYVPRGSLRPYMKRLTLSQIAGVLEGVLAGLAHGDAAGIVHRDLKPENIMVTSDGRVKITDFGIARATQRAGTQYITATGMTVGTPTYMAPEQAMAGEIGPWSDLYSVGVMTYELVVGHAPFHDTDAPMVILMRHVNERIPSPIEVRPEVDPKLSAWIDSLLVKDPQKRVHHAVDAWDSLEEIIVGLLGPLWRRNARLLDDHRAVEKAVPLTPAPFESQPSIRTPTPGSSQALSPAQDAFVTFEPGRAPATPPAPAPTPAEARPAPAGPPPAVTPGPVAEPPRATAPESPRTDPEVAEPEPVEAPAAEAASPPAAAPAAAALAAAASAEAPVAEPAQEEPESDFLTYNPSPVAAPLAPPPAPPVEPVPEPVPEAAPPVESEPEPVSEAAAPLVEPETEPTPEIAPVAEVARRESEPDVRLDAEAADEPAPEAVLPPEPETEEQHEPEPDLTPEATPVLAEPHPEPKPEPVTAAAPPAARRARPGRAPFVLLAAAAVIIGAAIGFLIAPSSSHTRTQPAAALNQTTSAGPLKVRFPSDWQQSGGIPSAATSLKLANPVTLTAGASAPGGALVLGSNSSVQPDLLPASFTTALGAHPSGAAAVTLGNHTFRRYLKLVPQNSATALSVYALPTATAGTVIAACMLPSSGADAFNAECESVLSSLQLPGKQLPLTANSGYAAALSATVAKLNRARASDGAALARAKRPSGQAAASHSLSGAYQRAVASVTKLHPGATGASANAAVASALRKLAAAYQALSAAAAHGNKPAYKRAQQQIAGGESSLRAAFAQLGHDGYTLG